MKKVLVSSLSRDFGGVESLFLTMCGSCPDELRFSFICSDKSAAREEDFLNTGAQVYHLFRPSKHFFRYVKQLCHIIKNGDYQIFHVNLTRYKLPVELLIAKLCGLKIVLHCHATQIYATKNKYVNFIRNLQQRIFGPIYLKCSDLNIACSQTAGEYLFPGKEYKILYNGIDIRRFQFSAADRERIRSEFSIKNEKVLGHIGRFSLEKNHRFLLDIFKECLKLDSELKLLCVGSGDLQSSIAEYAKKLGVEDKVVFTGIRKDIPALLSAMDVFVFPSIHEALPMTLIEAQANHLHCIVSDCVTTEIDATGEIKYLSLCQSAEEWARTVMSEMQDIRSEFVAEGIQKFDIKTMGCELEGLYSLL